MGGHDQQDPNAKTPEEMAKDSVNKLSYAELVSLGGILQVEIESHKTIDINQLKKELKRKLIQVYNILVETSVAPKFGIEYPEKFYAYDVAYAADFLNYCLENDIDAYAQIDGCIADKNSCTAGLYAGAIPVSAYTLAVLNTYPEERRNRIMSLFMEKISETEYIYPMHKLIKFIASANNYQLIDNVLLGRLMMERDKITFRQIKEFLIKNGYTEKDENGNTIANKLLYNIINAMDTPRRSLYWRFVSAEYVYKNDASVLSISALDVRKYSIMEDTEIAASIDNFEVINQTYNRYLEAQQARFNPYIKDVLYAAKHAENKHGDPKYEIICGMPYDTFANIKEDEITSVKNALKTAQVRTFIDAQSWSYDILLNRNKMKTFCAKPLETYAPLEPISLGDTYTTYEHIIMDLNSSKIPEALISKAKKLSDGNEDLGEYFFPMRNEFKMQSNYARHIMQ